VAKKMTLRQQAARYTRDSVPAHLRVCGEAMHFEGAYIAGHRAGSRLTKAERAFLDASKRYVDKHRRSCSLELCLAFDTLQAKKVRK
jgi:hypothetical protein